MKIGLEHLDASATAAQIDDSRAYFAARQATGGQRGPAAYDELVAARCLMQSGPDVGRAVERFAHFGPREASVRVTTPSGGYSRGVFLEIHGGGFFMDSARRGDARNARLADALDLTVVSVDYRLAPEHPWNEHPAVNGTQMNGSSRRTLGTYQIGQRPTSRRCGVILRACPPRFSSWERAMSYSTTTSRWPDG